MRTHQALPITCLMIISCLLLAPQAQAGDLSVTADATLASKFVWRGLELDDKESFQPSITLAYQLDDKMIFSFMAWWNIALDDHDIDIWKDSLFEQDFYLMATRSINDSSSLTLGYIYYSCPHSDVAPEIEEYQTDELFLGLDTQLGSIALAAYVYYDFDLYDAFYIDLTAAYSFYSSDKASIGGELHLGAGDKENTWHLDNGLVDSRASLTATYVINDHLYTGATLNYCMRHDSYEDATGLDERYSWVGASFGVTF